jgi:hypothetical protein
VSRVVNRRQYRRRLVVESASLGLGYTAVLVWIGSALVGSFTDYEAYPYWPVISRLRTDTAGFIAFAVAVVTLVLSRYLQLRRRASVPAPAAGPARPAGVHLLQALADVAVILGTGLVLYLSMNEVTHPVTLRLQLSHLLPGPSEGTVRVIGLAFCLAGVTVRRYLRASPAPGAGLESGPGPGPAAAREQADATRC